MIGPHDNAGRPYGVELRTPIQASAAGGPGAILGASLLAWYRWDNVVLNAGAVSQWTDLSGSGNHLVQAAGALQPPYVGGNLGYLNWSGTAGLKLALATFPQLAQPLDYFICLRLTNAAPAAQGFIVDFGSADSNQIYQPGGAAAVNNTVVQVAVTTGADMVLENQYNGASSNIYVNGVANSFSTAVAPTGAGITVGEANSGGATHTLQARVYELIITGSLGLSSAQRKSITRYLAMPRGIVVP